MTLLTTEVVFPVRGDPFIVFAADRRISVGIRRDSERLKIFPIHPRRAGIGYFGLAEVRTSHRAVTMERWLTEFLARNTTKRTLTPLLG